jgi:hypothetical protein
MEIFNWNPHQTAYRTSLNALNQLQPLGNVWKDDMFLQSIFASVFWIFFFDLFCTKWCHSIVH